MAVNDAWSDAAREMHDKIKASRPDLDDAALSLLTRAADLLTQAEEWDALVEEHGRMTRGSMGQLVVNPAAVEARQARMASAGLIAKLLPKAKGMRSTNQAQAAARARWGSVPGAGTQRAGDGPETAATAPTADGATVTPIRPRRDV